jgi:hypothetical protein
MERRSVPMMPPPYVSFNTFRSLREWLGAEGVPLRFDRSFWQGKFSGSNGTQLVAALRFLGLLDGDEPQPGMEHMVEAGPDEWRGMLAGMLVDSYAAVPFDELPRATPAMVRGWFRAYPIDGHTLRKAISFFVNASKEAELPMSNAVRKMAKSRSSRQVSTVAPDKAAVRHSAVAPLGSRPRASAASAPGVDAELQGGQANQTVIDLESGGTVTLGVRVDLFQLSARDREFVLKLIDLTMEYGEGRGERMEDDLGDSPGG